MMIHEVTAKVGKHKKRKRIGRGIGSGHGKTSGRGHKGAGSRSGSGIRASREGGQMPLFRRVPKRGFNNANFRVEYSIVNLKALAARFEDGDTVDVDSLMKVGLVSDASKPVKVLGEGALNKKLTVTVDGFSKGALQQIEAAGGTATVLDKPMKSHNQAKERDPKADGAKGGRPAKTKASPAGA